MESYQELVKMRILDLIDVKRARPREINTILHDHFGDSSLVGAEIGVWEGKNAREILRTLSIENLYLIDPYLSYDEYNSPMNDEVLQAEETAHDLLPLRQDDLHA